MAGSGSCDAGRPRLLPNIRCRVFADRERLCRISALVDAPPKFSLSIHYLSHPLIAKPSRGGHSLPALVTAFRLRNNGIMSNDIEDRTARYRNELAQCDRDDRSAENAEMCAPALIFVSLGIAVASFAAHETIGAMGIIGVIAGFVWRSDLKARAIARSERRSYIRRALKSSTSGGPSG